MSRALETLDWRSAPKIEVEDARDFLLNDLPNRSRSRWGLVEPALGWLQPKPLVVILNSEAFIYLAAETGLSVEVVSRDVGKTSAATTASTIVELSESQVLDLAVDQVTPMALFSSGQLISLEGSLESLLDWWLIIRSVVDETPVHVPGEMTFTDLDGAPLDLSHRFSIDDDPVVMNRFLVQCGYLHIGSAFDSDLMKSVSSDMDRYASEYKKGDDRSWWATLADGSDALVRMQGFDQHSPAASEVLDGAVLGALEAVSPDGHKRSSGSNRIEALFKPIGVSQGISDVPWHKDCALGRHHFECCALTVGVSVTGADAGSGQLKVVAGSHRSLVWSSLLRDGTELPVVELPTQAGDITVHLSCTLHMAQPPETDSRKVMYTSMRMPDFDPSAHADITAIREAAAVTVSQPPAHKNR